MKENIEEDIKDFEQWIEFIKKDENLIGFAKSSNPNDSIKLKQFVNILSDYKRVLKENEELKEYKRISELTKISCCTAQNCGALSNAIRDSLENEKLRKENEKLKELLDN